MPQIVSSAIWNEPPPAGYLRVLERANRAHMLTATTREKMVRILASGPVGVQAAA